MGQQTLLQLESLSGQAGRYPDEIEPSLIKRGPNNRKDINVDDLLPSIREHGIRSRLEVRPHPTEPGFYELISGERRLTCAEILNLDKVPVEVCQVGDVVAMEIRVIENIQRAALHPSEEAEGVWQLFQMHGRSYDVVAGKIGRSVDYVRKLITFRRLPKDVRDAVDKKLVSMGAALALGQIDWPDSEEVHATFLAVTKDFLAAPPTVSDAPETVKKLVFDYTYGVEPAAPESEIKSAIELDRGLDDRAFSYTEPVVEGCLACRDCPLRLGLTDVDGTRLVRCLDQACFEKKQNAALEPLREARRQQERAKAAEVRKALVEKLATVAQEADSSLSMEDACAQVEMLLTIKDLDFQVKGATGDEKQALLDSQHALVQAFGFENAQEMRTAVHYGKSGMTDIKNVPDDNLVKAAVLQVKRKAAGEDVTKPWSPLGDAAAQKSGSSTTSSGQSGSAGTSDSKKASGAKKAEPGGQQVLSTASPVAGADPADAHALLAVGKPHWAPKTDSTTVEAVAFTPVARVLEQWEKHRALGAPQMPKTMGTQVKLHVPELGMNLDLYMDDGTTRGDLIVRDATDTFVLKVKSGTLEIGRLEGLVLYRVHVAGDKAQRSLTQQLVIPLNRNGERIHMVLTATDGVSLSQDRAKKMKQLIQELPGLPPAPAGGASPAA